MSAVVHYDRRDAAQGNTLIGARSSVPPFKTKVHALPCTIRHDGPAAVTTYFQVQDTGIGSGASSAAAAAPLRAHFRGRALEGQQVAFPEGTVGMVLEEASAAPPDVDSSKRFMEIRSTFDGATVWQHDRDPGTDDVVHRTLEWMELAGAIHDLTGEEGEDYAADVAAAEELATSMGGVPSSFLERKSEGSSS